MESIVAMNNQASLLFENGAYEASLGIFGNALFLTRHVLQYESESSLTFQNLDTATHNTNTEILLQSRPCKHLMVAIDDECDDNTVFVYRSPLKISLEVLDEQEMDEFDLNCIILFNMALANHAWGLEEEENKRKRRLQKALKLYELCFQMQVDLGCLGITTILGLVNNCASIYNLLERTQRSEKFYKHMLSTLMAMIEIGEANEVDQLEGFLRNVSRLILQDVAAAAA
jgi:tetratricopeptide (TPR) repeat protein